MSPKQLASIAAAVQHLREGRLIIVVDDEDRENEGDVLLAAQFANEENITWIVNNSSGFICAPLTNDIADRLALPLMVAGNQDPRGTAYTVTVDAAARISTGISSADRANTLRVLAAQESQASDLLRPGHILPLRARDGGVRERGGHTEAAIDLLRLAGLREVGVISEIVEPNGKMMRLPGLLDLGKQENIPVIAIADLVSYLDASEAPLHSAEQDQ